MKNSSIVFLGLMLLLLAVTNATAATENNASKLTVQGDGKVTASPDMATIVLGVETQNASAAGAVQENAGLMNKTINALKAAGIAENNIQTSSFSLTTMPQDQPKTAFEKPKAPVFLVATNQVTVKLNNTTEVGRVLDAAVSAGSNSIQQVSFDLRDPRPQNDRAMTLAIEDARRQAEVAAKAAGVKLGRVLEITEGYGYVAPTAKSAMFADIATPIQPGQLEVSASVTVIYEIS